MAKALKFVAVAAGAVALIATGIGAVVGAGTFLGIAGSTFASIGAIAGVVAGVASMGATLLTKPPPARGSVTQVVISPDAPAPYAMGEGPVGGVLRHDVAYGATLNKIPNPYRWLVTALTIAGPVASVTPWVDQAAVSSWYTGFLQTNTQLGDAPETTALVPGYGAAPGWTVSSKLSGVAAIGWNLKFDKDGKRYASGVPRLSGYGQWVKVYDPRLDSTFPGGSGAQRIDDETTWAWSENPALHALAYAFGRYANGIKVVGVGLPADGIDIAGAAAWANVCDANSWSLFGVVYEPGDRWANLKEICAAGGGEPVFAGGLLSWKFAAPRVVLDTITEADLGEGTASAGAMAAWKDRINTVVPKYRSPAHDWELVDAEAVSVPTYVTEDGEVKQVNWPFNLVKEVDQAAQLAAYKLVDARELQPITLPCLPRLRAYRPGECLHLDLPSLGLDTPAVILRREIDPATMGVTLTLMGETAAKHAYALGLTGTPPPTPALGQTAQQRDELAAATITPPRAIHRLVSQTVAYPLTSDDDQINVAAFSGVLDTGETIAFAAATISGLASGTAFAVTRELATGTYSAVASPATTRMADDLFVFLGWFATSTGGSYTPSDPPPDGYGGNDPNVNIP